MAKVTDKIVVGVELDTKKFSEQISAFKTKLNELVESNKGKAISMRLTEPKV